MLHRFRFIVYAVGRGATYALGLLVLAGLLLGPVSAGLAAVGDPLLVGRANDAGAKLTSLVANLAGPVLRLTNQGAGPALDLRVQAGAPPLKVNSAVKVDNLNADQLDGKEATDFLGATAKAADADQLDGKDAADFLAAGAAIDAATLDGKDSADFLGTNAKAADADQLDGKDAADFLGATAKAADADQLDGKDGSAFGRPIAFGTQSTNVLLTGSFDQYVMGAPFTPAAAGKCLVTVSAQIRGSANASLGPYFRSAVQRGTRAAQDDGVFGHYFAASTTAESEGLTRSFIYDVAAGETTRFGGYFGDPTAAWVGDQAWVHLTYWCFTDGRAEAATASMTASRSAEVAAEEQEKGQRPNP